MKRMTLNDVLVGLTLVHFGQQLGSESRLAASVFDIISAVVSLLARISQVTA